MSGKRSLGQYKGEEQASLKKFDWNIKKIKISKAAGVKVGASGYTGVQFVISPIYQVIKD